MSIDLSTLVVSIVVFVVSAGLTFYLKDYIQRRSDYGKLKKKLEQIAGKGAMVVYSPGAGLGMGPQLFKIVDFGREGVTLQNEVQSIFVPASKLIQSEMIVPSDRYEEARMNRFRQDMDNMMDAMVPAIAKKVLPTLKEAIQQEMADEKGDFTAVVGIQVQKALESEGLQIKRVKEKNEG